MLVNAVAKCLRLPPASIEPHVPLTRYGLDSLSALELCVAIEEATGVAIDEDDLLDAPSIRDLAQRLIGIDCARAQPDLVGRMLADARLPVNWVNWDAHNLFAQANGTCDYSTKKLCASQFILLTGATGFLGVHLLGELLDAGASGIVCPARACDDGDALSRILSAARRYGVPLAERTTRIVALAADLEDARFGRALHEYQHFAHVCSTVIHCAADVNWALPYDGLRSANVETTRNLLAFACTGVRKRFHFVSSLAACYSTRAAGPIDEEVGCADPAGIHLGYAQSKWVAERLVEACRERGLSAVVHRPGLIIGHSSSGIGNDDDLLAQLLRGVIALGHAPDLDWRLDACSVDHVARAIARVVDARTDGVRALHLRNPHAVHWSEAVLWMNLRGYRVSFEPYAAWLERAERASRDPAHPLHRLRGFLLARPHGAGGRTLPEIYADPAVACVRAARSDALLAGLGLNCPRLDASMLERTFDALVGRGVLPRVLPRATRQPIGRALDDRLIGERLRAHFADPHLSIAASRRIDFGSEHSILGELAAWRAGSAIAMHARSIDIVRGDERRATLEMVVKPKYPDAVVLEVAEQVAALCGPELGKCFRAHRQATGLTGNAQRELRVYARAEGALRDLLPRAYGVIETDGASTLILERIRGAMPGRTRAWTRPRIEAALSAIGRIHGEWLERKREVAALLGGDFGVESALGAAALWRALSDHAQSRLRDWIGPDGARFQADLAQAAPAWMAAHARHARTLIHHDFNPRNCAVRAKRGATRVIAFDWELAEYGLPQRDAIEWLCFVLPCDARAETIERSIAHHREAVQCAAGTVLDHDHWNEGVRLALADFAVRRLPMYCMADRFKPQAFLERVTRTWWRLATARGCSIAS